MSKTVLITGAASGIGRATAEAFAKRGYTTYATSRRLETLNALATAGCQILELDVTVEDSMQRAVQTILEHHGHIDVLVNNAGYGLNGPSEELEMHNLRHQFETNVFGLVRLTQLVLPGMRRAKSGRIINVGSVGGTFTAPGAGAYHASKWALESITDALRFEVQSFGIDTVLIQPTGVYTNFDKKQEDCQDHARHGAKQPIRLLQSESPEGHTGDVPTQLECGHHPTGRGSSSNPDGG